MTAIRMALSELRRITAGRLPKLAIVALLCIPMLYGGLYLYANHDPYGRLDKVPTAVVVADAGTTLSTGEKLSVGPQVADELELGAGRQIRRERLRQHQCELVAPVGYAGGRLRPVDATWRPVRVS